MSDELNLDVMDLEELKAQARVLDISLKGNPGEDTLRTKIKTELGLVGGNDTQAASESVPKQEAGQKRVTISIPESETDTQPVQIYVNGRSYIIRRGEEVDVPESVIEVLNNAKQMVYNPETMKAREVLSYPFQIIK